MAQTSWRTQNQAAANSASDDDLGERTLLFERHSARPHTLEAVEVECCHFSAPSVAQAKHRRMRRRDAVRVLVDEHLVVGAIDRVVQHSLVQTDLNVLPLD